VVLEQDQGRRRVVRDLLDHVPFGLVREDLDPVRGGVLSADLGGRVQALLALDAETDECRHLAPDLDRLFAREVAQVLHLDRAVGVLVDGQRVDHAHGAAPAEALEFLDDLAVEVRMVEPDHQQLDRPDGHHALPCPRASGCASVITLGRSASSVRISSGNGYGRSRTLHASTVHAAPSHQPTNTNQATRAKRPNGLPWRPLQPGGAWSRIRSANGFLCFSSRRDSSLSAPGGFWPSVERRIPKWKVARAKGAPMNVS